MPQQYKPIPQLEGNPNEPVIQEELNELIQDINDQFLALIPTLVGSGESTASITPDAAGFKNVQALGAGSLFLLSCPTDVTVGGFTGGFDGRIVALRNNGSTTITLYHEFTAAPAEARVSLRTGTTLAVAAGVQLSLLYDGKTQRWVPLATSP